MSRMKLFKKNMKLFKKITTSFGKLPIFQKIALTYGGIFSVSLIIISVFISGSTSFFFTNLNHHELREISEIVDNYIKAGNTITTENLNTINNNHMVGINVIQYNSNNTQMNVISQSKNPFYKELLTESFNNVSGFNKIDINGQTIIYHQKITTYDNFIYTIQTFTPKSQEEKQLRFLYLIFMMANLAGIITSFIIGAYISKKMLAPIKDIRNTAERISIEDLNQRIDISGPNDDLKDLAITFNDMIERLDASFKKQNQFVSDASHELRTPIAVIKGYVNLIDRWGKDDPAVLQESIDSIKSETEHMAKLIKKLLFLAKSDQNRTQVQKDIVNLKEIGIEISKEIEIMEISQNFTFTSNDNKINIIGDYSLIKQMVWVLIENSIKYTKSDGNISLEIYKDMYYAYISVKDFGKGIPEEDIPYIFDRFYRVDKSRNKDIPGTGLGLSIAQWIAEQHNAKIRVFSQLGEGSNMIVVFPIKK